MSVTTEAPKEINKDATDTPAPVISSSIMDATLFKVDSIHSLFLQNLLEEYKAQTRVVDSVKEDLKCLEEDAASFFQNRKRFLYHGYTQTLDDCRTRMRFDVKLDAQYAANDKDVRYVFGQIYEVSPGEALSDKFSFERADIANKLAFERVTGWQRLSSLPEGHSISLMQTGKRVLERLNKLDTMSQTAPKHSEVKEEEPGAGKSIENRNLEEAKGSLDQTGENGHESESSGFLVGTDECAIPDHSHNHRWSS